MDRKRRNISARTRWMVFNRDNFRCVYCGAGQEAKLVIDHGDPFSRGGADDESNFVTACTACNAGKRDKPVIPVAADAAEPQNQLQQVTCRGVVYQSQLHADWAEALRQCCFSVKYLPDPVVVSTLRGDDDEASEVLRPDFWCDSLDDITGKMYVVIVDRCDVGAMSEADKARIRNAAILGYSKPTAIIIGSPWFFYGVVINDRHKGCPAGSRLDEWLNTEGDVYLSGWYPDETWESADFRTYENIKPVCVAHRGWHMTVAEAAESVESEVRDGI